MYIIVGYILTYTPSQVGAAKVRTDGTSCANTAASGAASVVVHAGSQLL